MNTITQLAGDFRASIQESLEIAHFMERGQADTPYADLFQRLEKESHSKPLGLTLLALTDDARTAALKWLYGHHFAVFSLEVSRQIGLLEVHLKEQGYFLEKSTGERLDFDDWDSFQQAVSDAELFRDKDLGELKVGTQTPTGVRNLQVLMPESSAFVAESPALLTRLLGESNLLVVAAPPDYRLTDTDTAVLRQLLEDMCAFWPLLPVDELAEGTRIPDQGWWDRHHSLITLPPTLLTTHIDTAIPPHLTEVNDELRTALRLSLAVKKYISAADALSERHQEELRRLQSRKKREERKGDTLPGHHDATFWTQRRTEINEECTRLIKQLQEAHRKRELPGSTSNVNLKQHIDGLTPADLNQEDSYKTIKLSLSHDYRTALTQFIQHTSREELKDDIATTRRHVDAMAEHLLDKCQQQLGYRPQLPAVAIDEARLWQDIKEMIGLELRYQGEIPKRGFIDRLSAGRRGAMMLLMSVMLLGYIGIDLRNSGWLGFILLPIFFGAVFYTYISFKKDEQHRLDKELTRVREELLGTSRRLVSDILRLKQTRLSEYLEQIKKQWQQQLDELARDHQARQQREREQLTTRARARISAIDSQLSEWQRYRQPVQKLMSDVEQLQARSRRVLADINP